MAFLATQIDQRSDELDQAIVTRRTKGLPSAKSVVSQNHQNRMMDTIQEITGQIRDEENRVLLGIGQIPEAWAFTTRLICRGVLSP